MNATASPSKSLRLAALRYHLLPAADRRWVLRQLSAGQRTKILAAYRTLKAQKDFRHLGFDDVNAALLALEDALPLPDVDGNSGATGGTLTRGLVQRLVALPDEFLAIVIAENLFDAGERLLQEIRPPRQRILQQMAEQQLHLVPGVHDFLTEYLRHDEI